MRRRRPTLQARGGAEEASPPIADAFEPGKMFDFPPATDGPPDSAVIWLHGLGDTGEGWAGFMPRLEEAMPDTAFFFPTASRQKVTVNFGVEMESWFDINVLDNSRFKMNPPGLKESIAYVHRLIEESGVPPGRVVLAGFSQGGALALSAAMSYPGKLRGLLCLSGWLASDVPQKAATYGTPVHFFHGAADPSVIPAWMEQGRVTLKAAGVESTVKMFDKLDHGYNDDELDAVLALLKTMLG